MVQLLTRRAPVLFAMAATSALLGGCASSQAEPQEPVVVSTEPPSAKAEQAKNNPVKDQLSDAGMLSVLQSSEGETPGGDDIAESDPLSARGNIWGDSIGESFGTGGLGLAGAGRGGSASSEESGLGTVGTIGHGAGTGTGQGFGSGHGRLGRSHRRRPPRVRMGATNVKGRLPPEVIQRIVRQNFGRFRVCYENELKNDPKLKGRVAVRFTISKSGHVSSAAPHSDTLKNKALVSCVVRAFYGLTFPKPEGGGIVVVQYPIVFSASSTPAAKPPSKPAPSKPSSSKPAPPPNVPAGSSAAGAKP